MTKLKTFFAVASIILLPLFSLAQDIALKVNSQSGVYKKGEKIIVEADVANQTSDSLHVKVWKNNIELFTSKDFAPSNGVITVFEGSFTEPISLIVDVNSGNKKYSIGAVVEPQGFQPGFQRPRDLEGYWNDLKKQIAEMPFQVEKTGIDLPTEDVDNYLCFDMELNCLGPQPARGYFAKPKNAYPATLPIVIFVRAAGVKGSWCKSNVDEALRFAKMGKGALCFDLNAHGMLNGMPDAYYAKLEEGELKDYWLQGIESKDSYYFRGMYLRLLRTIEFMAQQPEWDGQRILVIGESQGGGQALAAAGLDSRVSAVVATVPAMCDFGGVLLNRKSGWPQPIESTNKSENSLNTVPYFDTALLLKNSKATIVAEIGLIDQTCPASSIYAAINQAKGKKFLFPVTYRTHGWPEAPFREVWDKTVYSAKNAFIADYLK
jgi:cephalosporin-C deacetylase-like acetyl esterase